MTENIRLAFQGIWGHKMRSVLTMLGIIIGIAAIITIVSTIQGTNEQIKENLIGAGNNVVSVQLNENGHPYDMNWNSTIQGTNEQIKENLIGAGNNVVSVQLNENGHPYDMNWNDIPGGVRVIREQTRQELEKIKGVEGVSLYNARTYSDQLFYRNAQFNGQIYGVDPHYTDLWRRPALYRRLRLPGEKRPGLYPAGL